MKRFFTRAAIVFAAALFGTCALFGLAGCGCSAEPPISEPPAVGDSITMGTYNDADITWTVLEVDDENSKALLFAEQSVFDSTFNDPDNLGIAVDCTWADSSLRAYLNGEFLESAFSESERKVMDETEVDTADNATYSTTGGGTTTDTLFLLSAEELTQYFESDDAMANPEGSWYWLRSPGGDNAMQEIVFGYGGIFEEGFTNDADNGGVRPAVWVSF